MDRHRVRRVSWVSVVLAAVALVGATAAGPVTEQLRGEDIAVDYRLYRRDDRWLVYDVSIAGISLVANYRAQFNTIIQTSSYPELLGRIRTRLKELATPPPTAAR
jgi:ABC-type transporter MlaC component